ncbi:hypothetical protein IAU59_000574 [Kwoniella sp. CBS 9459]
MPVDANALEYDEEDDLFGSDVEINPAVAINAGSALTSHGRDDSPAQPSNSTSRTQTTDTAQASSSRNAIVSSPSRQFVASKCKERATQAKSSNYPAISMTHASTGRVYKDVDERLRELQDKKRLERDVQAKKEPAFTGGMGVKSLKWTCIGVIKTYSARIEDIGDLEYPIIKPFIDDLPMEQLSNIEAACPHIKKDTDWLWEIFLLQQFPLFHERCQDRRGEMRTSGWRRMFKKAQEDLVQRREQAAAKIAARYKELEETKASKSIVVMDKLMPDKPRTKSSSGWGSSSRVAPKPQNPIAKARAEAQRARVALTHASGRYIPPPAARPPSASAASASLFKNPYLQSSSPISASSSTFSSPHPPARPRVFPRPDPGPSSYSVSARGVKPPRIPAQGRDRPEGQSSTSGRRSNGGSGQGQVRSRGQRDSSSSRSPPPPSPSTNLIPGSYLTSQAKQARAALPPHLSSSARSSASTSTSSTSDPSASAGRFRIGGPGSTPRVKEIRKPVHPKFEAPALEKEKKKYTGVVMDFFATGSAPRPRTNTDTNTNIVTQTSNYTQRPDHLVSSGDIDYSSTPSARNVGDVVSQEGHERRKRKITPDSNGRDHPEDDSGGRSPKTLRYSPSKDGPSTRISNGGTHKPTRPASASFTTAPALNDAKTLESVMFRKKKVIKVRGSR